MTRTHSAVKARTNAQTSRPGWRPAKTSHAKLVRDIVASIQAKRDAGKTAVPSNYTTNPVTITLVEAALGTQTLRHEQPADAQALRRQQQAAMDKGRTSATPDCSKPCTGCNEPTTHGLLCIGCEDLRWAGHYNDLAEEFEYHMQFAAA